MQPDQPDLFFPDEQDIKKYQRERARRSPATRRYLIWFTPRSGSSWLTDIARETKRLSVPDECFNPNFMPQMTRRMHAANMDQYMQILLRRRNTNGVFGCEVTFYQMQRSFGDVTSFMRYFDGAIPIWLIREDIVLQAVSLVKMQQTAIAHSVEVDAETRGLAEQKFTYDAAHIKKFLDHVLHAENQCEQIFADYGHKPLRLSYEHNMAMGADHVLNAIAHHIRVRPIPPQDITTGHQKIGTDRNAEFADRFRAEHPDLMARVDDQRAARLAALDKSLPGRLPVAYGGTKRPA